MADRSTAAIAILTTYTSVASWYRPGRTLTTKGLSDAYGDYAAQIVGAPKR